MTKPSERLAKAIGKRLEALMENRGYSQKWMANKTGLSQAAINRYLHGRRIPAGDCVIAMAKVLRCSTDDILVGTK